MKLMNKLKISQVQFQASHIPAFNAEILEKSFNKTLKFKRIKIMKFTLMGALI